MASGLIDWRNAQIIARFPDGLALIKQAEKHGSKRRAWLLDQLRQRGADDLADEYQRRDAALARAQWRRKKRAAIEAVEKSLARAKSPAQREMLEKERAKLQRALARHEAKWCDDEANVKHPMPKGRGLSLAPKSRDDGSLDRSTH